MMKRAKTRRFETETRVWARQVIAASVAASYASWTARREFDSKAREPSLTVAFLTDDLDQTAGSLDYRCSPRRWRSSLVRSTCESMVRKGELGFSLGLGDRGEARCYEPAQ